MGTTEDTTDTANSATLTGNEVLFGRGQTARIVAVEPDDTGLTVYRRQTDGVTWEHMPFRPWIVLSEIPAESLPRVQYTELHGEGFRVLAEFDSRRAHQDARSILRDAHIEHITYPSIAKLALIRTGETLFKEMTFDDVVRMQFDLETNGLDSGPEANRILLIAVSDNRGYLDLIEGNEPEILERFVALVHERDPDVLEGHNVFGFDLPFLMARARRHGIALALGRDGSQPSMANQRNYAVGGATRRFAPVHVYGRHVVDTYLVVQRYDWASQTLSSYGLKECARTFGFAADDRVELPGAEIARIYGEDPELVRTYARQDAIETRCLADLISPVDFYQTQMMPDNYGQVIVTGAGEKINTLFLRAYLAAEQAIPRQQSSRSFGGGYTEVRAHGLIERVVKADVESLYPSLMLTHGIAPKADTLGVFLPALRDLTQRRLEAKRRASESPYWNGLQGSFKVLINSFYGYLGGPFCWNDYAAADRVTSLGRTLVRDIADRMTQSGAAPIEIDTDGVYFVPPADVVGEAAERAYIDHIGVALPNGIRLAFDGRYAAMLSIKTKNYVLLDYNGKRILRGASLRSRADERFGRRFIDDAVGLLLKRDYAAVSALYCRLAAELRSGVLPIEDLARRERVTERTLRGDRRRGPESISEEAGLGDFVKMYARRRGDLALVEHYAEDADVDHYVQRLYKFARRLEEAFEGDFDRWIPSPAALTQRASGQGKLDLFD